MILRPELQITYCSDGLGVLLGFWAFLRYIQIPRLCILLRHIAHVQTPYISLNVCLVFKCFSALASIAPSSVCSLQFVLSEEPSSLLPAMFTCTDTLACFVAVVERLSKSFLKTDYARIQLKCVTVQFIIRQHPPCCSFDLILHVYSLPSYNSIVLLMFAVDLHVYMEFFI